MTETITLLFEHNILCERHKFFEYNPPTSTCSICARPG